jgi:hypothetical protein
VSTYVIAVGDAAPLFDPVAAAGGTTSAFAITGGNVRKAVSEALASIVTYQPPCAVDVNQLGLPRSTKDTSLVTVAFEYDDGGAKDVTRVQSAADCPNHARDGWYVNESKGQVVLCPDLCAHPRANIRFEYGCRPPARATDGGR